MQQQIKKPAGRPVFGDGCGDGSFPQENHEDFSHICQQENYSSVHLLADLLDRHLELRAELALLRAENARLRMLARGRS
ncbi:MAG: hypothetical protein EOM37_15840 [Proteobacteria bacterium]|nr:hypothetical protein [Pseudomonadota bacterium]